MLVSAIACQLFAGAQKRWKCVLLYHTLRLLNV